MVERLYKKICQVIKECKSPMAYLVVEEVDGVLVQPEGEGLEK